MELPPSPPNTNLATPKVITYTKTINAYKINNIGLILGTSASIDVWFYDSNNSFMGNKTFIMSGTDYSEGWIGDDLPYVETWVEQQIQAMTTL